MGGLHSKGRKFFLPLLEWSQNHYANNCMLSSHKLASEIEQKQAGHSYFAVKFQEFFRSFLGFSLGFSRTFLQTWQEASRYVNSMWNPGGIYIRDISLDKYLSP